MNHTNFPSPWGEYFRWDVSRFFENRKFESADAIIDFLADRLSLVAVSDPLRQGVRALARTGDPFTWSDVFYDYFGRIAIYLAMASPEYQLQ